MTSKEEYLKKYLSVNRGASKKKKHPVANERSRVKILDDDIDVNALIPNNVKNTLDEDIGDDTPLVAEFLDERPTHVRELERFRTSKQWKVIAPDDDLSKQQLPCISQMAAGKNASKSNLTDTSKPVAIRRRHDSDSDCSPVRTKVEQQPTAAKRARHDSDSDASPVRSIKQLDAVSVRRRHDSASDSDHGLIRGAASDRRYSHDGDLSPVRQVDRKAHDRVPNRLDSLPPQVKPKPTGTSDLSPLRPSDRKQGAPANKHTSDGDLSPVRQIERRRGVDNLSSVSHHQYTSDSDLSLRRKNGKSTSDLSPVRHGNRKQIAHSSTARSQCDSDSDLSPKRKDKSNVSQDSWQSDLSPVRRHRNDRRPDSDSDLSPVRKDSRNALSKISSDRNMERGTNWPSQNYGVSRMKDLSNNNGQVSKTLSGAKAGLQMASDMRKEALELRQREIDAFAQISDELSGRNMQAIRRDKATGRKRNMEEEEAKKAQEDALKAVTTAKYEEWNKGVKQKQLRDDLIADTLHEVDKPLARYGDDADLDARLREQEREGDTMLEYIRKKKVKASGKPQKPLYRGPEPPPNRFGIRPGYRWDGVDRSNGFEKLYFGKLSDKKALKDMAYKWSVEDM